VVRIAVFSDPARARKELAVAAHVDQRDGAEQRPEPLRIAHQHVGDENAAVRAALGRDPRGARDAAADEIGGDSGEIVMRARLAGAPAGLVPTAAELAAAPQVRDDARSAAFEPELAD